jgi:DNA-binding response OmpR family regulator
MVDDDPNICSLVKDYLESKGYAVLTAGNGVEAMRLMMFHHPHLLICDIKMPQKNGYRLLSELRQLPEFRLLPVILLTELDDSESRIQGYEVGCDVYLPKPFDLAELLAIIRNLLVERQLYFDGLLDSQSLAKIDLRVLVAPHFKLDRPLERSQMIHHELQFHPRDLSSSAQIQEAAQVSINAYLQSGRTHLIFER